MRARHDGGCRVKGEESGGAAGRGERADQGEIGPP